MENQSRNIPEVSSKANLSFVRMDFRRDSIRSFRGRAVLATGWDGFIAALKSCLPGK